MGYPSSSSKLPVDFNVPVATPESFTAACGITISRSVVRSALFRRGLNIRGQTFAGKIDLRGDNLRRGAQKPGRQRDIELLIFRAADQSQRAGGPAVDHDIFSFTVKCDLVTGEIRFSKGCRRSAR